MYVTRLYVKTKHRLSQNIIMASASGDFHTRTYLRYNNNIVDKIRNRFLLWFPFGNWIWWAASSNSVLYVLRRQFGYNSITPEDLLRFHSCYLLYRWWWDVHKRLTQQPVDENLERRWIYVSHKGHFSFCYNILALFSQLIRGNYVV